MNGSRGASAQIDTHVQLNARAAVEPVSLAYSSMTGVLDVISSRRERRRVGLLTDTGRPIICNVDRLDKQVIIGAFEHRVIVSGLLKRNGAGQPVRLDADALELIEARPVVRARDLLGIIPSSSGTGYADAMNKIRRRGN